MAELSFYRITQDILTKADKAVATTTTNGLFSSTDKIKLDSIPAGANNYLLGIASYGILGGVKIGTGIDIDGSGVISISTATISKNGLLSLIDKTKLDSLTPYSHPLTHPATMITEDASNRFVTDAQIAQWNGAAGGAHTHTKTQITDFTHTHIASDIIGSVPSAITSITANNLPTSDVGGNVWIANTVSGIEGTSGAVATGSSMAPYVPVVNQIWFDVANRVIKYWDGTAWQIFGGVYL